MILYSGAGGAQIVAGTFSWEFASSYFDDPRDKARIEQDTQLYYSDSWMHSTQPVPGSMW